MKILTQNNDTIDTNEISNNSEELNFFVFDNSKDVKTGKEPDYYCVPLLMLESFHSPSVRLRLEANNAHHDKFYINVPLEYQLLIGEPSYYGDLEINPISSLSGRGFHAFCMNPTTGFRPEYFHVEVEDVLPTIKWWIPKMTTGQLLALPLTKGYNPKCIYMAHDLPKAIDTIQLKDLQ